MTDKEIRFIFDKIFKRVITLSSKAVIDFINGIFETNYPENSSITYNWTESVDDELVRKLADAIITVNGVRSYHIEAQMENDEDIVFRMFDYGYRHACNYAENERGMCTLYFPEPKVLYLYSTGKVPEKYTLRLDFGSQGCFNYEVSTFNFQKLSIEELNQKKLFILIPFQLLKLRDVLMRNPSPENIQLLKSFVNSDILCGIADGKAKGSISVSDALVLYKLTEKLYNQLYARNLRMEEFDDMFDHSLMLDCGIVLDCDVLMDERDAALLELEKIKKEMADLTEQRALLKEQNENLAEQNENLAEQNESLAEQNESLAEQNENLAEQNESLAEQLAAANAKLNMYKNN